MAGSYIIYCGCADQVDFMPLSWKYFAIEEVSTFLQLPAYLHYFCQYSIQHLRLQEELFNESIELLSWNIVRFEVLRTLCRAASYCSFSTYFCRRTSTIWHYSASKDAFGINRRRLQTAFKSRNAPWAASTHLYSYARDAWIRTKSNCRCFTARSYIQNTK